MALSITTLLMKSMGFMSPVKTDGPPMSVDNVVNMQPERDKRQKLQEAGASPQDLADLGLAGHSKYSASQRGR